MMPPRKTVSPRFESGKMEKQDEKITLGWRERIDLPQWGIRGMRAKIDTGANSSSLHVEDVRELPHDQLEFHVILDKRKRRKRIVAKRIKKGRVRSGAGIKTSRWYVETTMRIGNIQKKVMINLVDREGMNFRMLIGRNALREKFLVDVSRSYHAVARKNLPTSTSKK